MGHILTPSLTPHPAWAWLQFRAQLRRLPFQQEGALKKPPSRFLGLTFACTVQTFLLPPSLTFLPISPPSSSSSSSPPVVLETRGQDALAPGDSPATKAAFTVPAGWGRPQRPVLPARRAQCGAASAGGGPKPPGMPSAGQPRRVLASPPLAASSLSRFAGQGTGFTGSSRRQGEGGLRRGQGLILVTVAGWRPGQPSSKPLTHPGGSPSVIQREGSCPSKLGGGLWEYLRAVCRPGDRHRLGELSGGTAKQTSGPAAFPFSLLSHK